MTIGEFFARSKARALGPVTLGLCAFLVSGCAKDANFYSFAQLPLCSAVLDQTKSDLRIVFMVDNSDSTRNTDPDFKYRESTIRTFLGRYGSRENFSYSYSYFDGSNQFSWNGTAFVSNPNPGFGGAGFLGSALDKYITGSYRTGTPYGEAFDQLRKVVQADVSANGSKYGYAVVFMSDGRPTDIDGTDAEIDSLVGDLVAIAPGKITVSSVYFGPDKRNDDVARLQRMAAAGQGVFVDTNVTGSLAINEIISVPGHRCAGPGGG